MIQGRPLYDGFIEEFLQRIRRGIATIEDLRGLLEPAYRDPYDPTLPTAGVYFVIRHTELLFSYAPFRPWVRALVAPVPLGRRLREHFAQTLEAGLSDQDARAIVCDPASRLQEVVLRGLLQWLGFARARGWHVVAKQYLGDQVVNDVIVQHLREGDMKDVRLLMGYDPEFDSDSLMEILGPQAKQSSASACAARAPELFLYRAYRFRLPVQMLEVLLLTIVHNGYVWLEPENLAELLTLDHIPPTVKAAMQDRWGATPQS